AVARQREQLSDSDRSLLTRTVGELVRRAPVAVPADATVLHAARVMTAERVSSVLVTDGDRLVGILTDRDLRTRVLAAGADPQSEVAQVMTPEPTAAPAGTPALEALITLLSRNIHHLPVV